MDSLADLPTKDNQNQTPQEISVLQKYFEARTDDGSSGSSNGISWKVVGYAMLLFLILGNPWIDAILSSVSFCESHILRTLYKTIFFGIVLIAVMKFA